MTMATKQMKGQPGLRESLWQTKHEDPIPARPTSAKLPPMKPRLSFASAPLIASVKSGMRPDPAARPQRCREPFARHVPNDQTRPAAEEPARFRIGPGREREVKLARSPGPGRLPYIQGPATEPPRSAPLAAKLTGADSGVMKVLTSPALNAVL